MNFTKYRTDDYIDTMNEYLERLRMSLGEEREKFVGTKAQHEELQIKHSKLIKEKEKELKDEYYKKVAEFEELFWRDTFEELGISENHPKAPLLKSIAHDEGHSNGYYEIFYYAKMLAPFLKE
jgi:hypothetical protein